MEYGGRAGMENVQKHTLILPVLQDIGKVYMASLATLCVPLVVAHRHVSRESGFSLQPRCLD
jgi:hypothetical protein